MTTHVTNMLNKLGLGSRIQLASWVWFVFFAGLRTLIAGANPRLEYLGTAIFGLGAALLAQSFIFLGMAAAATANVLTRPDNSVIYLLFMGGSVLDGAPVAVTIAALHGISGWGLHPAGTCRAGQRGSAGSWRSWS